jgi:hypothetical protein
MEVKMALIILGMIMGCFLGFIIVTMLVNSKKADEESFRMLECKEGEIQKYLPVIPESCI